MKLSVLTVQNTPKLLSPHFTLVGNDQVINDSNDFDEFSANASNYASKNIEIVVLLNCSSDGVICGI